MWNKNINIRESCHWIARMIELIELKEYHVKNSVKPSIVRGGIYNVELGNGNIGGEKNKLRPCLVISKCSMNHGDTVVIIPLSSKFKVKASNGIIKPYYSHHYILKKENYSFLTQDSCLKVEDIRSIEKVRIRNYLGSVDHQVFGKLKLRLLDVFGF